MSINCMHLKSNYMKHAKKYPNYLSRISHAIMLSEQTINLLTPYHDNAMIHYDLLNVLT